MEPLKLSSLRVGVHTDVSLAGATPVTWLRSWPWRYAGLALPRSTIVTVDGVITSVVIPSGRAAGPLDLGESKALLEHALMAVRTVNTLTSRLEPNSLTSTSVDTWSQLSSRSDCAEPSLTLPLSLSHDPLELSREISWLTGDAKVTVLFRYKSGRSRSAKRMTVGRGLTGTSRRTSGSSCR